MKRLSLTISETKESIGAAFLPILERLLPVLQNFAVFVQNNTKAVVAVIAVIGTLSAAILALNAVMKVVTATQLVLNLAMAANPIGIVVVALGALAAAFALAWNKSETFRSVFASVANTIIGYMNNILHGWEAVVNGIVKGINVVISGINKIKPGSDINPIGTINIRNIPLRAEWCVDESWFRPAHPDARFMHCLPVRRNVKVADEVLDGPRSVVVRQAGNRLHAQKALLIELLSLGAR